MSVAVLLACIGNSVNAEVRVIADYRLGEGGSQVNFPTGPDRLLNRSGEDHALQHDGSPTFSTSAPTFFVGSGSLQLDEEAHYYSAESAMFGVGDHFILEPQVFELDKLEHLTIRFTLPPMGSRGT